MYEYKLLKDRILKKYKTQVAFANAAGVSKSLISQKLSCKAAITKNDIENWSLLLGIKPTEYGKYFFS